MKRTGMSRKALILGSHATTSGGRTNQTLTGIPSQGQMMAGARYPMISVANEQEQLPEPPAQADMPRPVRTTMNENNRFYKILHRFTGLTMPKLPTKRSKTPFHYFNTKNRQGPHQIPFVYWNVFWYLITQAGIPPEQLVGTRIIPYPRVALRVIRKIAQEAIDNKAVTKETFYANLRRYMTHYVKLYRQGKFRELIEANPSQAGHLWSEVSHDDMAGKGERASGVARYFLGDMNAVIFDLDTTNEHNRYKAFKRLEQTLRMILYSETELSEDSERNDPLSEGTMEAVRGIALSDGHSDTGSQEDGNYGQPEFEGPNFGAEKHDPEESKEVFEVIVIDDDGEGMDYEEDQGEPAGNEMGYEEDQYEPAGNEMDYEEDQYEPADDEDDDNDGDWI